ncbi:tRNA glutamyl-Q(34) synthetase GluQRS [Lichenihabitans sp. Uapishka_5]|uniref:tRNA glutamyl-Q(34) synthetase GluQRS n=1 Tax=Lichenihabitans sp. Uapishka_5 TaxID=3037302 RepID=UPI0029E812F3|nr:tRNA glutamyl-Q(34) synthetase GluQRS [Lichenihabitans sp. Uapishka_5]MDX7952060.1 tRNA glutamyl-Q(34) synthetase GluQRS [Lichenihabitans sp. Uapishka_5]
MPASPILRFAPSPDGFLHLGHAYSALMNQRLADRLGGTLLLRFEDIDPARCRPEHVDESLADLAWLGIRWQGPVWQQSTRLPAYAVALAKLDTMGLTYPCFCSRGDIARVVETRPDWPRDPDASPLYPGTCRHLTAGTRTAWQAAGRPHGRRIDMAAALSHQPHPLGWTEYRETPEATRVAADPALWGDALLARKDVATSYHIAVVVDDAAQAITDIVRGEDLFAATSLHRLLQALLRLPEPAYHHHRLIRDLSGNKLAKSRNSATLRSLRHAGTDVTAIWQSLEARRDET